MIFNEIKCYVNTSLGLVGGMHACIPPVSWCSSPLKQVPAIVGWLMMTLLRLPHRQKGEYILCWCFAEIFVGVADCDEGRYVQFVSNATEVPGTIE